jgi:hypothetical protein
LTIVVTETESQAVLNAFTEHDFQEAFKKWQEHWEWDGRTSPRKYGWFFVEHQI